MYLENEALQFLILPNFLPIIRRENEFLGDSYDEEEEDQLESDDVRAQICGNLLCISKSHYKNKKS